MHSWVGGTGKELRAVLRNKVRYKCGTVGTPQNMVRQSRTVYLVRGEACDLILCRVAFLHT